MEGSLFSGSNLIAAVEVFTAIAVVIGIIFGLIELRQATRNRRDHAAVDIVRTVQTQEVRQAVRQIFDLSLDADPQLIRNDPELLAAALAVDSACEMWGCMVFEGVVDHKLLDRMVGGWVRGTWARLRAWVESERVETQSVNVGEWWQWLYELLEADPDLGKKLGAHISYRGKKTR
ncbi:MAG: hypothetical protein IIA09_08165 [Proteobacteria bacterium]|nr:hypothetical protein [Pseudomonadota bacterium]